MRTSALNPEKFYGGIEFSLFNREMLSIEKIRSIIFRKLTDADFFNINKPPGTEVGGGGQSYIDIPVSAVNLKKWRNFFKGLPSGKYSSGPRWNFKLHSLGVNKSQITTIGQRRKATFSIRSQKLLSRKSNRVYAWHPEYTKFPVPVDPSKREHIYNLVIFLALLENGEYWAGWFQTSKPEQDWPINDALNEMFLGEAGGAGIIENTKGILFDVSDPEWPFRIETPSKLVPSKAVDKGKPTFREKSEDEIIKELLDEDESVDVDTTPTQKEVIRKIRVRNHKLIRLLKDLYNGKCQLTGSNLTFKKRDGTLYSEVHHLIPIGDEGSDSILNLVVVSPLIHRMLHYADVSPIDLTKIKDNKITITINEEEYTIRWHPDHVKIIEKALKG